MHLCCSNFKHLINKLIKIKNGYYYKMFSNNNSKLNNVKTVIKCVTNDHITNYINIISLLGNDNIIIRTELNISVMFKKHF